MEWNSWALGGIALIVSATIGLGVWGTRNARTTSDFLVARRGVGEERNAAAISGEYLSAASFLGIAGLVLKDGIDALWYPIGFSAGYLFLMLFVAAPLRRSGAYTLPDFVEARLGSIRVRWLATTLVVLIGWLYLVPQLQGAGLTLAAVTAQPYWMGVCSVTVLVLISVLSGGMRVVTLVQAFQYWFKMFAISVPAFVLLIMFLSNPSEDHRSLSEAEPPVFQQEMTIDIQADARLEVTDPTWVHISGERVLLRPGEFPVRDGERIHFPQGSAVPSALDAESDNASWLQPQDDGLAELLHTYSLIIATFLGTMGLPHVLVRFYTNPSGQAARRTTLFVLLLLGGFYLFPTILGVLSRFYVPELLINGKTDAAVLLLPSSMADNWIGGLLGAVTAAGAFAAFLATSSGLVVSAAGVLSKEMRGGRVRDFRLVTVVAAVVPTLLALVVADQDISQSVGLAFAMAASTFSPLLVLGIWWRGLTAVGAASGMVTGGGLVLAAVALGAVDGNSVSALSLFLDQPALLTVPVAFLTAVLVSRATREQVPPGVARIMLGMHAPERLGLQRGARQHAARPAEQTSPSGGRHHRSSRRDG